MANDAGPEAKQWALAATAILTTLTRREPRHDLLGGAPRTAEAEAAAKAMLAQSWSVDGRDKLIAALEWLGTAGASRDYQAQASAFAHAPPQQRQQDPAFAFVAQFGPEIGPRGLLAWDLGRLLAVSGWGFLAGYCSEDEAWGAALSAGARLRAAYGSWDEFAAHYRMGALFSDPASVAPVEQVIAQIAAAPNGPWRQVAWRLDGTPATSPSRYDAPPPTIASGAPAAGGAYGPPGYGAASPPAGAYGAPPVANPGFVAPGANPAGASVVGSYGGVPVIAPPPGGGSSGVGSRGGNKLLLLGGLAVAGIVGLAVVIALFVHFRHHDRDDERERRETPHGREHRPGRR